PGRPPEDVLPVRPERAVLALDPERECVPVRVHGAEILDAYPLELAERLGVRAVLVITPGRIPDSGGDAGRATVEEEAQAVEMVDRDLLELRVLGRREPRALRVARHPSPVDQRGGVDPAQASLAHDLADRPLRGPEAVVLGDHHRPADRLGPF